MPTLTYTDLEIRKTDRVLKRGSTDAFVGA